MCQLSATKPFVATVQKLVLFVKMDVLASLALRDSGSSEKVVDPFILKTCMAHTRNPMGQLNVFMGQLSVLAFGARAKATWVD